MTPLATWLFVPGDRPERFEKAATSGADQVVVDLEDAVPDGAKPEARESVVAWLADGGSAWVRVNAPTSRWFESDIAAMAAVVGASGLRGILVPKADHVTISDARISRAIPVVPLIETAIGVRDAYSVASLRGVVALAFGSIDLAANLACEDAWGPLLHARSRLVLAARSAGLPGPIDGVHADLQDPDAAGQQARRARSLGFAGKLCIHPNQIEPVRRAFEPTAREVAWATQIADAIGGVAVLEDDGELSRVLVVNGEMVDRPVLFRARHILHHAR